MRQIDPSDVPADDFNSAYADFQVHPKEGLRLVKAFLRINSPGRRQAVKDMARVDEAERSTPTPN
jgi:hypothetical protein